VDMASRPYRYTQEVLAELFSKDDLFTFIATELQ